MTHTDINKVNEAIFKKLNPGGCWHEKAQFDDGRLCRTGSLELHFCKHCNHTESYRGALDNPNYHTPEGTQLMKAWLKKEGNWEGFLYFVEDININLIFIANILTDPKQFAQKFYEYIGSDDDKI